MLPLHSCVFLRACYNSFSSVWYCMHCLSLHKNLCLLSVFTLGIILIYVVVYSFVCYNYFSSVCDNELRKVYNPASKLNKTTGGDYKGVFEDFQEFTTVPEQLLEVLEDNLGDVEGRKVQCEIFQVR